MAFHQPISQAPLLNPYSKLYKDLNIPISQNTSAQQAETVAIHLGLLHNALGTVIKDLVTVLGYQMHTQPRPEIKPNRPIFKPQSPQHYLPKENISSHNDQQHDRSFNNSEIQKDSYKISIDVRTHQRGKRGRKPKKIPNNLAPKFEKMAQSEQHDQGSGSDPFEILRGKTYIQQIQKAGKAKEGFQLNFNQYEYVANAAKKIIQDEGLLINGKNQEVTDLAEEDKEKLNQKELNASFEGQVQIQQLRQSDQDEQNMENISLNLQNADFRRRQNVSIGSMNGKAKCLTSNFISLVDDENEMQVQNQENEQKTQKQTGRKDGSDQKSQSSKMGQPSISNPLKTLFGTLMKPSNVEEIQLSEDSGDRR